MYFSRFSHFSHFPHFWGPCVQTVSGKSLPKETKQATFDPHACFRSTQSVYSVGEAEQKGQREG